MKPLGNITLAKAYDRLEAALVRMMAHPARLRPFVVLKCSQTHAFVQFCGSNSDCMVFDVPLLDRQVNLTRTPDYRGAVQLAFDTLGALQRQTRFMLDTPPKGQLMLEESLDAEDSAQAS